MMKRRTLLGGGAAALAAAPLHRPALAQSAASRTLRFVPQTALANFDPVFGTQIVVRNAAAMVWDTLYACDASLVPQRQMVEAEEVSGDGLGWTFRLRPGLRFHDGQPVLARDAVASIVRWAARDPMGQRLAALQRSLEPVDDRNFRLVLGRPFPRLAYALGQPISPAFIMPERLARTDPFKPVAEFIGSGPFRFLPDELVAGDRAAFARFDDYVPVAGPPSWMAGAKRAMVDRVEWRAMPDAATAAAALQNGEVDWWESPIPDLVPLLRRDRGIQVEVTDRLGNVGALRMNHLHPPFSDPLVRRAVMMATSQQDHMQALVGDDPALWKRMAGFFTPGAPTYTEQGAGILQRAPDREAARRTLARSSYDGRPVTVLAAQDQPISKTFADVTADMLQRIGMAVDLVALDWAALGARRASKEPPARGGWNIFHSWFNGVDCTTPAAYPALRANGAAAWFGWPDDPAVERAREDWFTAPTPEAEQAAIGASNAAAVEAGVFVPTGCFVSHQAWRRTVTGVAQAPRPLFWGVSKA